MKLLKKKIAVVAPDMAYFPWEIRRKSGEFHQAIKKTRNQYARVGERNGETNNTRRLLVTVMGYSQR